MSKGVAPVTGASAGLGVAYAELLAPGLEDEGLLESSHEAQRTLFRSAVAGGVASRSRG